MIDIPFKRWNEDPFQFPDSMFFQMIHNFFQPNDLHVARAEKSFGFIWINLCLSLSYII